MSTRLAAWSISGAQQDTWRIHSTLVLPDTHVITTLDNKAGMIFRFFKKMCPSQSSGLLAIGFEHGLSVYTLVLENDLPTWSEKWTAS